jgi:shikimate kinase
LRPMLTEGGKPIRERIAELLAARAAAYARAEVTIDTSDLNIDQVVEAIVAAVAPQRSEKCRCSA